MNEQQLAAIPGLLYVQIPISALAWCPGMDPFAMTLIEHWPGYVDTRRVWLKQSRINEDELRDAGWTVEQLRDWTRYHPPGGPRPPAPPQAKDPARSQLTGPKAKDGEPLASHYTTIQPTDRANPRRRTIAARYADGRPARYADGTVIVYDAAGRQVEFARTGSV